MRPWLVIALAAAALLCLWWLTSGDGGWPLAGEGIEPTEPGTETRQAQEKPRRLQSQAQEEAERVRWIDAHDVVDTDVNVFGSSSDGRPELAAHDLTPAQWTALERSFFLKSNERSTRIRKDAEEKYKSRAPLGHPDYYRLLELAGRVGNAAADERTRMHEAMLQWLQSARASIGAPKPSIRAVLRWVAKPGSPWGPKGAVVVLDFKFDINDHPRWKASVRHVRELKKEFEQVLLEKN